MQADAAPPAPMADPAILSATQPAAPTNPWGPPAPPAAAGGFGTNPWSTAPSAGKPAPAPAPTVAVAARPQVKRCFTQKKCLWISQLEHQVSSMIEYILVY